MRPNVSCKARLCGALTAVMRPVPTMVLGCIFGPLYAASLSGYAIFHLTVDWFQSALRFWPSPGSFNLADTRRNQRR